jgi:hypothetical protein
LPTARQRTFLAVMIERISVGSNQIDIHLRPTRLSTLLDIAATRLPGTTGEEPRSSRCRWSCVGPGGRSRC